MNERQSGEIRAQAFKLMKYASADGRLVEWVWNSRTGLTPFSIRSRDGVTLTHVGASGDVLVPDHKPKRGQRIFVDLTMERAKELALQTVARYYAQPEAREIGRQPFANGDEAFAFYCSEFYGDGGRPDLIEAADWNGGR